MTPGLGTGGRAWSVLVEIVLGAVIFSVLLALADKFCLHYPKQEMRTNQRWVKMRMRMVPSKMITCSLGRLSQS